MVKRRGRPPMLNPDERCSTLMQLLVTEREAEQIRLGAAADQRTVSNWLRNVAMNAVHQSKLKV